MGSRPPPSLANDVDFLILGPTLDPLPPTFAWRPNKFDPLFQSPASAPASIVCLCTWLKIQSLSFNLISQIKRGELNIGMDSIQLYIPLVDDPLESAIGQSVYAEQIYKSTGLR